MATIVARGNKWQAKVRRDGYLVRDGRAHALPLDPLGFFSSGFFNVRGRLRMLNDLEDEFPGLAITGNYVAGVSTATCIDTAVAAVDRLIENVKSSGAAVAA